jgi:hypothetical protein
MTVQVLDGLVPGRPGTDLISSQSSVIVLDRRAISERQHLTFLDSHAKEHHSMERKTLLPSSAINFAVLLRWSDLNLPASG